MDSLSLSDLQTALLVFLALCAALATVGKAVDVVRSWLKPAANVSAMLANDKRRLDAHDEDISDIRKTQSLILQGTNALLNHAIHDGNKDELLAAQREISRYLINR